MAGFEAPPTGGIRAPADNRGREDASLRDLQVGAGERVLVTGASGGVGSAAIQLARWAGATVVTTVSSDEKGRLATAAGAHHAVDYTAGDPGIIGRAVPISGIPFTIIGVVPRRFGLDRFLHEDFYVPTGAYAAGLPPSTGHCASAAYNIPGSLTSIPNSALPSTLPAESIRNRGLPMI